MQENGSTVIRFDLQDKKYEPISIDDIDLSTDESHITYWIHCNLNSISDVAAVQQKLNLPSDLIDLSISADSMPKVIDATDSLTIRTQCIQKSNHHKLQPKLTNLIIYLTPHYCLTFSSKPVNAVTCFINSYSRAIKYAKTPCFILFLLLDNVISDFSEILFDYELIVEAIDTQVRDWEHSHYNKIINTKKDILKIKRHTTALRDILMRISGRKIDVISIQCRASLVNLLDHSQMLVREADAIRDSVNSTLDQLDSTLMQQMNESMKVLAAFAAIFLPLSLIAGIYGMNFIWMPELHWKYGYLWAIFLMFICGVGFLILFKKKKWL